MVGKLTTLLSPKQISLGFDHVCQGRAEVDQVCQLFI